MMIESLHLPHVRETPEPLISGATQRVRRRTLHRVHVDPCGKSMFDRVAAINRLRHGRAVMATTVE